MAEYSYKRENDVYRLYESERPMTTVKGNLFFAKSESLAKQLVEAFEKGASRTSGESILTYHYFYCDLSAAGTLEEHIKKLCEGVDEEALLSDPYLTLCKPYFNKHEAACLYAAELPDAYRQMDLYQIAACLALQILYESKVLPYLIMTEIISNVEEEWSYGLLVENFLDAVVEYDGKIMDTNAEPYRREIMQLSRTIDAFVFYTTLED